MDYAIDLLQTKCKTATIITKTPFFEVDYVNEGTGDIGINVLQDLAIFEVGDALTIFAGALTKNFVITPTDMNDLCVVYVDLATNTFGWSPYSGRISVQNYAILFYLWQKKVYGYNQYAVRLKEADGTIKASEVLPLYMNDYVKTIDNEPYNEVNNRLILPPKMYFISGHDLPLYKSSIIPSVSDNLKFKTALINVAADNTPRYQYFDEDVILSPTALQNSFRIGVKQNAIPNYNYFGDITKVVVDASTKIGATPKILAIGDSLTQKHMATRLKNMLVGLGVNPTMVGTYLDDGGTKAEGRNGWEFANFVGKDNTEWGTVITRLESGAISDLHQNPFLKLATETDKTNHPDWCFRNTGVDNEKSYTTDTDKTGNFYIFDFAWYQANHSVDTPDIISIALSTNDIWRKNSADAIAQCRLSLEIMVRQIKTALPTVKIGIVPSPAWGSNEAGDNFWTNTVTTWIEHCMTDIRTYQQVYTDIYIVPVWCHMSRDWNWDAGTTTDLTDINQTKKAQWSEYVHFSESGKMEYVESLGAWTINAV
jgi:lysophospholipase L1-like esterase